MNLLDGRPAPVAPLHYYLECWLLVRCSGCGRRARLRIGELIREHRLPRTMRIHETERQLRCKSCGGKGLVTGVDGWHRGE